MDNNDADKVLVNPDYLHIDKLTSLYLSAGSLLLFPGEGYS